MGHFKPIPHVGYWSWRDIYDDVTMTLMFCFVKTKWRQLNSYITWMLFIAFIHFSIISMPTMYMFVNIRHQNNFIWNPKCVLSDAQSYHNKIQQGSCHYFFIQGTWEVNGNLTKYKIYPTIFINTSKVQMVWLSCTEITTIVHIGL